MTKKKASWTLELLRNSDTHTLIYEKIIKCPFNKNNLATIKNIKF